MAIHHQIKGRAQNRYERHYHPQNPHHKKHIVADLILASVILFLSVLSFYLVIFYKQAVLREQIDLIIILEKKNVASGGEFSFAVFIRNNTDTFLTNVNLTIPEIGGFTANQREVDLGTLDAGESKDLSVQGFVVHAIEEPMRVSAVLSYKTGTVSFQQEKLTSEIVDVFSSHLMTQFDIPETVVANQVFPFTIHYQNTSEVTLNLMTNLIQNQDKQTCQMIPSVTDVLWFYGCWDHRTRRMAKG